MDILKQWHDAGYDGTSIVVWNCENMTSHGTKTRQRILDSAPEATVISASVSSSKAGVKVHCGDEDYWAGDFLEKFKPRIVNASLVPAPFLSNGTISPYWKEVISEYDLCVFCSSGNDSNKKKHFDDSIWYVGAITDGKNRARYSNGGPGLDFVDYAGKNAGTSFSSPFLAGKCALVRQRYPTMNRDQIYRYMADHCEDLGDIGEDPLYGNGLFVLPELEDDMEITTTKVLVDGKIKEVRRVMVNDENYFRLRDFDDVLGICTVDYDKSKNLPIIKKG